MKLIVTAKSKENFEARKNVKRQKSQKQFASIPSQIKGSQNRKWYTKLIQAKSMATSKKQLAHINNEIQKLNRKFGVTTYKVDFEEIIEKEDRKSLPKTPWIINSRKNKANGKHFAQNSRIKNNTVDYWARQINGNSNSPLH